MALACLRRSVTISQVHTLWATRLALQAATQRSWSSVKKRTPGSNLGPLSTSAGTDKLERFLSKAGVLSRTNARVQVREGKVLVNGVVVHDPWHLVRTQVDKVQVEGFGTVSLIDWETHVPTVVVFNKPQRIVTTFGNQHSGAGRLTSLTHALPLPWRNLLAPHVPALRPIGRLDSQSVGMLLLTDCPALARKVEEPGCCEKEYVVHVRPEPDAEMLQKLRSGMDIQDKKPARGPTEPCEVSIIEQHARSACLRFTLREGRNRQLRRMCGELGLHVDLLQRVRVGPILLGELRLGEARDAAPHEVEQLVALSARKATK